VPVLRHIGTTDDDGRSAALTRFLALC